MPTVKESPAYVKTSLAGAMCLGLERGKFYRNAQSTCLNVLLTYESGCRAACSYCGLARTRKEGEKETFIRVKWPLLSLDEIMQQLKRPHPFRRVCVSMITHARALEDTAAVIKRFYTETELPISALICPTVMKGSDDLKRLKQAGADHIGIAVDAATPGLFDLHRGKGTGGPHKWGHYWDTMEKAVKVFGAGRVGVHLIVGLGENEREMVKIIDQAQEMGVMTHLFSFFPEGGSALQDNSQPPLGQYRRVQLARYLINQGVINYHDITFMPSGQIAGYGIEIEPYLKSGHAFMTSGCPGQDGQVACNRPFANERVNQAIRNFPFIPDADDLKAVRTQLWEGVEANA
ncbi:radical SAM protein [Syntrophomonas erecta]